MKGPAFFSMNCKFSEMCIQPPNVVTSCTGCVLLIQNMFKAFHCESIDAL